jgi:hypothetical protein
LREQDYQIVVLILPAHIAFFLDIARIIVSTCQMKKSGQLLPRGTFSSCGKPISFACLWCIKRLSLDISRLRSVFRELYGGCRFMS